MEEEQQTIIPYTVENTNFQTLKAGDRVNLEFDIVGKYLAKMIELRNLSDSGLLK